MRPAKRHRARQPRREPLGVEAILLVTNQHDARHGVHRLRYLSCRQPSLFAVFFEFARDRRPGIARLRPGAARRARARAGAGSRSSAHDVAREVVRLVGGDELATRHQREPFGAHRRRDHRPCPSPAPRKSSAACRRRRAAARRTPTPRRSTGRTSSTVPVTSDAGPLGDAANARGGIAADDGERRVWNSQRGSRGSIVSTK